MEWYRVCELIPDGVSTMSKMPCRHVDGFYPKFIQRARGAYLHANNREYIDYEMGLGAVLLGHADKHVTGAAYTQMLEGTIYGAPSELEGQLAEKLVQIVPSAQMVRFTVTGSEACQAAVKLARAYTGRQRVISSGYHGWHSMFSAGTPHSAGCLDAEKVLLQTFEYNDLEGFQNLLAAKSRAPIAACIIEPVVLEPPKRGFLRGIRDLCTEHGIVLIFDEVVTGFRWPGWTAQAHYEITPDLTCLGKAMANGVTPISAVCGKAEIMALCKEEKGCFISSTYGANPLALAAALATIRTLDEFGSIAQIWSYGERLMAEFEQAVQSLELRSVAIRGFPCRNYFQFPSEAHLSLFWQECLRHGVWLGYAQFVSAAHGQKELDDTVLAMRQALDVVKRNWKEPEKALEGKVAQATFRMREAQQESA